MIIPLRKFLVLGASEDLDDFFHLAQQKGFIEFIAPGGKHAVELPANIHTLILAHKILLKLPVKKPYEGPRERSLGIRKAERIVALKQEIEKLQEELRLLEAEIFRIAPFGDFSLEDIDFIERKGHQKVQFFCMKTAKRHKTNFTDEVFYINTEYDLDYFITINPTLKNYPDMIEMRIDRSLGDLKGQHALVAETLHERE